MTTKTVGVTNNKQKSRRQAKHRASSYYERRKIITEVNRKRKQLKHQKMVEKKASRRVLFILPYCKR